MRSETAPINRDSMPSTRLRRSRPGVPAPLVKYRLHRHVQDNQLDAVGAITFTDRAVQTGQPRQRAVVDEKPVVRAPGDLSVVRVELVGCVTGETDNWNAQIGFGTGVVVEVAELFELQPRARLHTNEMPWHARELEPRYQPGVRRTDRR
jgi:hypothetical protein